MQIVLNLMSYFARVCRDIRTGINSDLAVKGMDGPPSTRQTLQRKILSNLYAVCREYPSQDLHHYEIRLGDMFAQGGFGDCFRGIFLDQHQVALKRLCSYNHEKSQRVFYVFLSSYLYNSCSNILPAHYSRSYDMEETAERKG